MKKCTATFVGENSSMGLVTGQEYLIEIYPNHGKEIQVFCDKYVQIPYGNIIAFLNNWNNITWTS